MRNGRSIKKLLKDRLGINPKHVRVNCDRYSMEVLLLTYDINIDNVERILSEFENIRRCAISGDILEGGNYFVNVSYCSDRAEIPTPYIEAARTININFGPGFTPVGTKLYMGRQCLAEKTGIPQRIAGHIFERLFYYDPVVQANLS